MPQWDRVKPSQTFIKSSYTSAVSLVRLSGVARINIVLACLAAMLLAAYVAQANIVAASSYQTEQMESRVAALAEANGTLEARQAEAENPSALIEFAQQRGMVLAKEAEYLFENGRVALR